MKKGLTLIITLIVALAIAGCCSSPPDYSKYTAGSKLYDLGKLHEWKYRVSMNASGVISSWDMDVRIVNESGGIRHMMVTTVGDGMDIVYNIWSNVSDYSVERMNASGNIGDRFQEREVSKLQLYTIPDVGLAYVSVPFSHVRNMTIKSPDGIKAEASVYSATDNKGFSVSYLSYPPVPAPLAVEMGDKNFLINMSLLSYS